MLDEAWAWELTHHSYARRFCLPALITLEHPDRLRLVDEGMDACETGARETVRDAREATRR